MKMVNYVAEELRKRGFKVAKFVRIPSKGVVDVYGERRDGEVVIAECLLRPTKRLIEEKIRKYSGYGKLLIVIPESYYEINTSTNNRNVEIWRIPISATTMWTVNVGEELDRRFRETVFKVKGYRRGVLKEALEEAIRLWLEKYESQK